MPDVKIGIVTHYFDKLSVAVIKLTKSDLKVGDTIIFKTPNGEEIKQTVESMQIEHASIDIAKAGDEFGLRTKVKLKAKTQVFKVK